MKRKLICRVSSRAWPVAKASFYAVKPIAEIRALPQQRIEPRPIGLARGQFQVTDAFFEPLPEDISEAFAGRKT